MKDYIDFVFNTNIIDNTVFKAALRNIAIAEALIPVFFAFTIIYDMLLRQLKMIDGDRPSYFSAQEIARVLFLMFMAGPLYLGIFWPISVSVDKICKLTEPTAQSVLSGKAELSKNIGSKSSDKTGTTMTPDGNVMEEVPSEDPKGASMWDMITGAANGLFFTQWFLEGISWFLISIIGVFMKLFAMILAKVMFAIGPLVVAFSIIPAFKDKLSNWFGVYLNCLFVPLTVNVLDYIFYSNIAESLKGTGVSNPLIEITVLLVTIICYCLSFWLTSFYVGSSAAGRVLSTAASIGQVAVGKAVGMFGGGGGGSAGGGTGSGGNIIEDSVNTMKG
jgi:hypothetical protein